MQLSQCGDTASSGQTYGVVPVSVRRHLNGYRDSGYTAYIAKVVRVERHLRALFLIVGQQHETVSISFEVATKNLHPPAEDVDRSRPPLPASIAPRIGDRWQLLQEHPGPRCDLCVDAPDRTPLCQSKHPVVPKTQL